MVIFFGHFRHLVNREPRLRPWLHYPQKGLPDWRECVKSQGSTLSSSLPTYIYPEQVDSCEKKELPPLSTLQTNLSRMLLIQLGMLNSEQGSPHGAYSLPPTVGRVLKSLRIHTLPLELITDRA